MTWLNTLRSINGVSEPIAKKIANRFKSSGQLINALNNTSIPIEQRELVLQEFVATDKGRNNNKLSRRVFRVFSSFDDSEMVNSDDDS